CARVSDAAVEVTAYDYW
nr:immunoglobulin heavy chain junction region [Macaca mulatta]MOX96677.1 immunoglobulin heavy chain junction region [Macaca mulatta]